MAEHSGSWYPLTQKGVQWDASGNPYYDTSDGMKSYLPPIAAAQYRDDPKTRAWATSQGANVTYGANDANGNPTTSDVRTGAPHGGFAGNYHWNGEHGWYEKDNFFDSSLGGLILGGAAVGGPIAASTFLPSASAGAAAPTAAAPAASSTSAAVAGGLPSTTIGTGMMTPITGGTGMTAGSGGMGFMDAIKSGFDWYNKASGASNSVTGERNGPSAAQSITQLVGDIEKGRASGLVSQAQLQQMQDRLAQARAELAMKAPGMRAQDAVHGDVLANSQDASFSGLPSYIHIPEMSGGLRPSMLSQNTRQLGAKMSRDALTHSMKGDDVPNLTPLPESNGFDTTLQGIGLGSGFLGALGGQQNKRGGGSSPTSSPYAGAGTPGYPGDATSADNPMIAPPAPLDVSDMDQAVGGTAGLDPAILEYWRQQIQGGVPDGV